MKLVMYLRIVLQSPAARGLRKRTDSAIQFTWRIELALFCLGHIFRDFRLWDFVRRGYQNVTTDKNSFSNSKICDSLAILLQIQKLDFD